MPNESMPCLLKACEPNQTKLIEPEVGPTKSLHQKSHQLKVHHAYQKHMNQIEPEQTEPGSDNSF